MKFPNFNMNKSFTARALVILAGLLLMATASFAQKGVFAPQLVNPSVDIDQCANGPLATPIHCDTASGNSGYTRGNLNESKWHYVEGQSIPIRVVGTNLIVGKTYHPTLGYDFTKAGKFAVDYLTTYDRTESVSNNPCVGVTGCAGPPTTFAIPVDPQVTNGFNGVDDGAPGPTGGDDIAQIAGN